MATNSDTKYQPVSTPSSPRYKNQVFATFIANLSIVSYGCHYAWPSPNIPKLLSPNSEIPITTDQGSWIIISISITSIVGCIFAAATIDKIGRKKSILITIPVYTASWIIIAFATNFWTIMIGRLIAGFADGITMLSLPIYIGEVADKKVRGSLGGSVMILLVLSIILVNCVAPYISIFQMSVGLSIIPVLQFVLLPWVPETPQYYLMQGNVMKAKQSLQCLNNGHVETELNELELSVRRQMRDNGSFLDIIRIPWNRKAFLIATGARTFQLFSGAHIINSYMQYIFSYIKGPISPVFSSTVFLCIKLIVCVCACPLLDRLGRKLLYAISSAGCGISLTIVGFYFYFPEISEYYLVPIGALWGFISFYSIGVSMIPVTIISEIFPANIKAKSVALLNLLIMIQLCLVTKLFQFLIDIYGLYVPLFIFAIFCFGGILFATCYLPETKNKTLEEIQLALRGGEKLNYSKKNALQNC